MTRAPGEILKFQTPFGPMFAALAKNSDGTYNHAQIAHQMKDPDARVTRLVSDINAALRELAEP